MKGQRMAGQGMRVEVHYVRRVSDEYRRRINAWYGRPGLATRQQVRDHLRYCGTALDEELMDEVDTVTVQVSKEHAGWIYRK